MVTRIISSQLFLDDGIVAEKLAAGDFTVTLSPEFELGGETYQAVLDGHHSFAAARGAGAAPDWTVATVRDADTVAILGERGPEAFLAAVWTDSDWRDIYTDAPAF